MRPAVLAVLLSACAVPRDAGFGDVQRLLAARGIERVHWKRGGAEDAAVERRIDALLAAELDAASAVEVALLNNPRVQATYERLGVAQAEVVQAGLLRNPSFGIHIGLPVGTPAWQGVAWEFSLAQELIDLVFLPLKKRLAKADFERVKIDVGRELVTFVFEVRAAFRQAQAAHQIAELRALIADAAGAAAELARRQEESGTLSELDAVAEQALSAEAKLELLRARQAEVAAAEQLARLLGLFGSRTNIRLASLPALPSDEVAVDRVEAIAVSRNLELTVAKGEVDALAERLRLTKATRFIGSLELGGDSHREPEGTKVIGPSLRVELPLFDQGQAKVARAVAEYRAARRRYEALAIAVRSEARQAANRLLTLRAAADYYALTLLPLRERLVALNQQQYNAMLRGVYQLLQAKKSEVTAQLEYIEVIRDYFIARADLERIVGAPLPVDKGAVR